MDYQLVSLQQMKDALAAVAGSKYPVRLLERDGTTTVRFVRGFADSQYNVVLVSETSYSLALKILETKDIAELEYAAEHPDSHQRVFKAKWIASGK